MEKRYIGEFSKGKGAGSDLSDHWRVHWLQINPKREKNEIFKLQKGVFSFNGLNSFCPSRQCFSLLPARR